MKYGIIDTIAYTISARSRRKKYQQFLRFMQPHADDSILDVGANVTEYSDTDNYLEKAYPYPERITIVSQENVAPLAERYPNIRVISGDGRQMSFADNEFDIAYSNAVIEHVLGEAEQLRFLQELYRVSRRGYITTPNRRFAIEIHTRVPLAHLLLSEKNFHRVLQFFGKGWAGEGYMDLLDIQRLRRLVAAAGIRDAVITPNRFCGLPMTFTVTWKKYD